MFFPSIRIVGMICKTLMAISVSNLVRNNYAAVWGWVRNHPYRFAAMATTVAAFIPIVGFVWRLINGEPIAEEEVERVIEQVTDVLSNPPRSVFDVGNRSFGAV
jgi:hypothetical protein